MTTSLAHFIPLEIFSYSEGRATSITRDLYLELRVKSTTISLHPIPCAKGFIPNLMKNKNNAIKQSSLTLVTIPYVTSSPLLLNWNLLSHPINCITSSISLSSIGRTCIVFINPYHITHKIIFLHCMWQVGDKLHGNIITGNVKLC